MIGSPTLQTCPKIKGYMGSKIQTLGKTYIDVEYHGKRLNLPVYVVDGNDIALMGLDWIYALDFCLTFERQDSLRMNAIDSLPTILNKFSKLLSNNLGNFKGYDANICVPLTSKPIISKPRVVHFTINEKIKGELKRLSDLDIIEKVDTINDQIKLVSPIVCVIKQDGSVRI
ncbi:hypothetical protein RF11_16266 [Thelohanellus kitauei]|uniref:Uncharacterized protein n=1 Tax=Thelohanellus kitauei TaxID=669202 RepID=A0A0C2MCE2_THEKT|nr:hypothetical protein RF11_16266 [Thelohanellus kitauei]